MTRHRLTRDLESLVCSISTQASGAGADAARQVQRHSSWPELRPYKAANSTRPLHTQLRPPYHGLLILLSHRPLFLITPGAKFVMFRAQQNAFDDVVGMRLSHSAAQRTLTDGNRSEGDRREPDLGELGIHPRTAILRL